MRHMILKDNIRADERNSKQIRPIDIEQSVLPRTHGSSLFTRGETQAIAVCTLGGESMAQRYEDLDGEGTQPFLSAIFFPPFSVGEVGRVGAPGRREIGHGKLAERALKAVLPPQEKFPYTIRLESNITESNGSSSMASVCGGCLAMMDAGVPIKRPVAGIAMGLILEGENMYDPLRHPGHRRRAGRYGLQSHRRRIKESPPSKWISKWKGLPIEIMRAALAQAKEGRIHILNKMLAVCPKSKEETVVLCSSH